MSLAGADDFKTDIENVDLSLIMIYGANPA